VATADLNTIGLPASRAATIRALARAVADGELKFEGVIDTETF
jgi:3-methyladenine DNA glycosylase/8-oxoguanine DNA glycosylase